MSTQLPLFPPYPIGGATYCPELDEARLGAQQRRVLDLMKDGHHWWTLRELADRVGASEASVSARIRDLRKAHLGYRRVDRRRKGDPKSGLFEYRLVPEGEK